MERLSYERVWVSAPLLLVLLLRLPLACQRRHLPMCCSHQQEVTTPLATHAPPLQTSVLQQLRALPLWPLQMQQWAT